jgi:2-isopropylmalate synthase
MDKTLTIYDTTLRDGTQREGLWLSCDDKLRIAQKLDELGVDYIEGGWPGSNPKDVEFFQRLDELDLGVAKIAAFGSTCRANSDPAEDANIQALIEANTPVCTIFGKSWTLHVTEVLKTTLEENQRIIFESVQYLKQQNKTVFYDAEHFFDGFKANPDYALSTLAAAQRGGADALVLCDTNGGCLPDEVAKIVSEVVSVFPDVEIGIHAHNDGECAVANSMIAVSSGATHIQGTINGYGERCGNANLCSIIPNLELKQNKACLPAGNLSRLYDVSHFVSEIANLAPEQHTAYIGVSAFAHKAGVHVAALQRNINSYQHIDPELVGNQMRTVVSELSGRGNLLNKALEFNIGETDKEDMKQVLESIKLLESQGFSFESAEASVALMMHRRKKDYQPPFELIDFFATVEHRSGRGMVVEAMVKVRVNGETVHTIAEGNGPVNALDLALRKALLPYYPQLDQFQLSDYKVRIIDGNSATAATTRVLLDTQNGHRRWSTVGASPNIIEASWLALADSIEYGLVTA